MEDIPVRKEKGKWRVETTKQGRKGGKQKQNKKEETEPDRLSNWQSGHHSH